MRRVRRRGVNKEKVFGCDLLEHLNASCQEIPQVLKCCSEFVEHHGIVDGIYRLSGVSSNIQKLRGEFESDGNPDLNKDVYLQDIHCISSLCKAYFRELPNPLLTYQLYDKFAEAVALQLEEERLVKIGDVLKELPSPHYRTLEFLMRHLVRMASYSSETNMHSRNLAIVWAPNLLRSKDIEATGFNGTAAFMEVRVQSIVVEFILTHVPQLFPELDVSGERRKSLPSPSSASNQDDPFLKSVPARPIPSFGNISPGDGPLPIRPYHSIIEGTDKRKGSLKGRKWMSIFNIGGRFHETRRRHKNSAKEKDRSALRPARSMDSLSIQSYANEGSKHPPQTPPSTNTSPLVTSSPQPGSEATAASGGMGGNEYAVTYRRGTGLVSGGTQGTYTALDPEGSVVTGSEGLQSRSPGLSAKAGRRAAMHITGPTIVTVPLHITSNLAFGVLQGGGSDRVVHRGRDKDGGDRVEGKEGEVKVERKESKRMERKESKRMERKVEGGRGGVVDVQVKKVVASGGGEEKGEGAKAEKEQEEEREVCGTRPEPGGRSVSREQRVKSLNSSTDDEGATRNDHRNSDYIDMESDPRPEATEPKGVSPLDASDILNSTEAEGDDQELFGYVQDNFEFLDHMDCCVMDHMDSSVSYQVNEFSVEPPGHSDDEYDVMVQAQPPQDPEGRHMDLQPGPETRAQSQTGFKPHRPLSLDLHSRHTKSLSLPYMTSPVHGPDESCSEEEEECDISDDDEEDYSSEEDGGMFHKSLPADFILNNLSSFELDTDKVSRLPVDQRISSRDSEALQSTEPTTGDQEREEVTEEREGEPLVKSEEENQKQDNQPQKQSLVAEEHTDIREEEKPCASKPSASSTEKMEKLIPIEAEEEEEEEEEEKEEEEEEGEEEEEEEEEVVVNLHTDDPPCCTASCSTHETGDSWLEETGGHPGTCDEEERQIGEAEDRRVDEETETTCQEMGLEKKQGNVNLLETSEEDEVETADDGDEQEIQEGVIEEDGVICRSGFWEELEDVICEVIEESEQVQREVERAGEQEEQHAEGSGENREEEEEGGTSKTEGRIKVEEQSTETAEEKLTYSEEKETSKLQLKSAAAEEAQHQDREDETTRETEHRRNDEDTADEQRRTTANAWSDLKTLRCEESDRSQGGGGGGFGRKLVISKHPKVYQVRAVPVVPPKPQHCKLTAMTLRQQQREQREPRAAEGGGENTQGVQAEQERVSAGEQGKDGGRREKERRRDGEDTSSPLSMCFDEAVAIATMRRGKERGSEKERSRDQGGEVL